jgi:hypothetical protein
LLCLRARQATSILDFEEIANVAQARCSLFCATHGHNNSKQTMALRSKQRKKNPNFIDWRNSSAKKAILFDLADSANVAQARCSLFCATHSRNKSKQTMALRSKQRKKNPKFIDWRNSLAKKAILFDLADLLDPETSPDDAWDVYQQRDEFAGFCWEQGDPEAKNLAL